MKNKYLIFPNQIFEDICKFKETDEVILIEERLFFLQYKFHKQKIIFHRATMKFYEMYLKEKGCKVRYIEAEEINSSKDFLNVVSSHLLDSSQIITYEPHDFLLKKLLARLESKITKKIVYLKNPLFITTEEYSQKSLPQKDNYFFTDFYIRQRKIFEVLLENNKPVGGKWTYDIENRKKLPKELIPPTISNYNVLNSTDEFINEAKEYVNKNFPNNYGNAEGFSYPITFESAKKHFEQFINERFNLFGDYEDSISKEHKTIYHSLLTPALNVGLISPQHVISTALNQKNISLNSQEGFIRQVIGWREFMMLVYNRIGTKQRNSNFFKHNRKIPKSFYDGTTGVLPFDNVVKSVIQTGYCHHIERLMILGNFMFLCEIDPNHIYQWFMELFIDAYDWVMVPNVYGMSQHADGGLITTKPYISGSSYILKMSDYPKGDWCQIWDALYWNHISKNVGFYKSNPRMSVMVGMCDKLGDKLTNHKKVAEQFLDSLENL